MTIKTQKNGSGGTQKPVDAIETLHNRLGDIAEQCKVMQNVADAESRSLNAEEMKNLDELKREFDGVENEIRTRAASNEMDERITALASPNARRSQPDDLEVEEGEDKPRNVPPRAARSITGGLPVGTSKGTHGFRSMGEWAMASMRTKAGKPDQRIMNAPSTFGSEGINEDGGFAVPPDFRANIMKSILSEESILARCDQQTTQSNSLSLPLDHTSPWQTSGGVQPVWIGEGATITASKPQLKSLDTKLHKLAALVPITEELMEDSAALSRWLTSKVPEKFTSFINDVIINGDGVGKPMGMLNAASKVTVPAVSGQGANTVVTANITSMWSRAYGALRGNACWFINQDVEPQLQQLVIPGASPSFPAYLPPGGFSAAPYATLLGRPVIPIEACQALGTEGDIILAIPNQYLVVTKGGSSGLRTDVSLHLYFDSDHTTFRFIMRIGGQSYWPTAIARKNGSNTLSPIITLNSTRT